MRAEIMVMAYHRIGKITGTHGLDGRVVLRHELQEKNLWSKIPHLFIALRRESFIPYFIEDRKVINHEEVLLKLDETDSVELARALSGKDVYLEEEVFSKLKPKAIETGMIGFRIVDRQLGLIGTVADLYETPGQVLATVQYQGKEVMIPLVDATIRAVDGSTRTISVDLPDGLLDVYL